MNTDEIDIDAAGLIWDKPHFYLDGEIFIPKIFEMQTLGEPVPENYNVVAIKLDGRVSADLDWKAMDEAAQRYCDKGLKLLWKLDLGFFDRLKSPLSNQSQFLSLTLSLEHFRDALWKKFKDQTLGVCLYDGPADFASQLPWDEHLNNNYLAWGNKALGENFQESKSYFQTLFARDAVAEYLTLMANRMPDALQIFLMLNIDSPIDHMLEAQLVNRERFDRFHLIIKNGRLPAQATYQDAAIGICLPGYHLIAPSFYYRLEEVMNELLEKKIPFRIIPESFLINEWDGLDFLIVDPAGLSSQGKRKLQGFCAAGGTVATVGEYLGLTHEISYNDLSISM